MSELLLARSVSERMFSRQSTMMEKLIANPTTSLRILERHLSKFDNLWASLQEKHDMYVIE